MKKIMRDKRPIWQKLRNWIDGGNAAVPEGLPEKIAAISEKTDQALEKIQAVASQYEKEVSWQQTDWSN